ncbi:MAG: hypothetical protein ABIS45_01610 [Burkholderiales bacterium]
MHTQTKIQRSLIPVLAASMLLLGACGKKDTPPVSPPPPPAASTAEAGVTVSAVRLGRAIGGDKRVTTATDTFSPKDTIYAEVATTGAGAATLKAKWTYSKDGKTVDVKQDSMQISPAGPATNEFHVSKPDGWPMGEYAVEIMVNGKSEGTHRFDVK